jgi:hypothetical protein
MKRRLEIAGGITLAVLVGACGNTKVLDAWRDSGVTAAPAHRIAVVGLSGDENVRRLFEDTFSAELKKRGNDAVAGYTVLSPQAETNADSVLAALRGAGFDAVLTARSLGVKIEETEVSPTSYYIPDSGYYGWNGYYGPVYQEVNAPDYTQRTRQAMIETHLYLVETAKLVWGARSSTTDTGKLTESMRDYARTVVRELGKTGFIE